MQFKYNLTAVGVRTEFPYVVMDNCVSMDCPHPGAELGNGTADITIFAIVQQRDRMEKVDFSLPIGLLYVGYYVREIAQLEVVDYILSSFQLPALLLLILSSLTVAVLLFFYTRVFHSSHWSLPRFIMSTFFGLLKQHQLNLNGPICVSILTCAWLWFSFAIIMYYETKLRGLLMLTRYRGSLFTNLDEAMDAMEFHGWKMIVPINGYSPFSYCRQSQCERLKRLQKKSLIKELEVSLLIPVLATRDQHFVFGALPKDMAPHRKSLVDDSSRILFVRDELITPMYLAFAVRKGMPELLEKLNQAIAIMSNSFNTIRGRYSNPYEKYADKQFYKRQTALTVAHFQVVFHFGWRCFLVAFILFVGEIVYHRHGQLIRDRIYAVCQKFLHIRSLRSVEINGFELSQHNSELGQYTKTVRNGNGGEFSTSRKGLCST